MFVSQKALNGQHLTTAFFLQGEESKWCRLAVEEAQSGAEAEIKAYGITLALITSLKYLGRFLLAAYNNWPELVRNLCRAHQKWARLTRVLSREGVYDRTSVHIYLAVVQLVILYGS